MRHPLQLVAVAILAGLLAAEPTSAWQLAKPLRPLLLPQAEDHLATRLTVEWMPKLHVAHRPVDEDLYRRTLDEMLVVLDPRRLILTADDVRPFYNNANANTAALKQGNAEFAFNLVRLWVQRLSERLPWIIDIANRPPSIDEFLISHPSDVAFTNDSRELQRRWLLWLNLEQRLLGWDGASDESVRSQIVERYRGLLPSTEPNYLLDVRGLLLHMFVRQYDPRSRYMTLEESCYLSPRFKPKHSRIGAGMDWQDGSLMVKSIEEAGPAFDDGRLQVGDRVLAYVPGDNLSIFLPLQVRPGYREPGTAGPPGTTARILVVPRGKSELVEYRIVRADVETSRLVTGFVMSGERLPSAPHRKLGYVKLSSFFTEPEPSHSTSALTKRILQQFIDEDVEAVLLDLRSNHGWSLAEVLDTAGLFVGKLPVVQVPDPGDEMKAKSYAAENATPIWNGPLVVLTNRQTAHTAEVFVGALRDHQRALLIGNASTSGLGNILSHIGLGNVDPNEQPNKLQDSFSVAYTALYRPSGEGIQKHGVTPHIVLPSQVAPDTPDPATRFNSPTGDRIAAVESPHCGYPITAEMCNRLVANSLIRRNQSNYWQQPPRPLAVSSDNSPLRFRIGRTNVPIPRQFAKESKLPEVDEHLQEAIAIALDYLDGLAPLTNRRTQG